MMKWDCGRSTVNSQKGEGVVDSENAVVHGIEAKGDGERQPTLKAKVSGILSSVSRVHKPRQISRWI